MRHVHGWPRSFFSLLVLRNAGSALRQHYRNACTGRAGRRGPHLMRAAPQRGLDRHRKAIVKL
ncbi:hypothetical protein DF152_33570 [Burkholderia cenocepacia]|nr:hypothetical protein DF152_33570 [Burkholderia cenocepacia]